MADSIIAHRNRDTPVKRPALIIVAAAATIGAACYLGSCNSDKLAGCTLAALDVRPADGFVFVAVGDSASVYAATISDCPAVGRAVTFSLSSNAFATVRAASDTVAILRGLAVGETTLRIVPRDYPQNRDSLTVEVIGPNP